MSSRVLPSCRPAQAPTRYSASIEALRAEPFGRPLVQFHVGEIALIGMHDRIVRRINRLECRKFSTVTT
jgi:hypothetical protein